MNLRSDASTTVLGSTKTEQTELQGSAAVGLLILLLACVAGAAVRGKELEPPELPVLACRHAFEVDGQLFCDGELPAAAERLESVVVDGFVRRGGKYFPGCQREMCASLPRALAPVCGAVVSEGMYPGPVARTPEFGVYVN